MQTRVIKSVNRRDAKFMNKQIDTLGIRASLRSRNDTERKMAIHKLLDSNWWLVEGYSPRKIGDLLASIYLVGFSHNLFIAPIKFLKEFRRRAELHRGSQLARQMKAELEDEPLVVDSDGDPVGTSESVESLVVSQDEDAEV
jgi:hypothetical protein